jgi:hypothetical protein
MNKNNATKVLEGNYNNKVEMSTSTQSEIEEKKRRVAKALAN